MLLKDKCHEKAMATVKNHKADAINRFSAKREKIFTACPEAKAITEKMETAMNILLSDILNDTDHFDECRKTVTELRILRQEALNKCGFKEEDLETEYYCPICKDTGAVGENLCTCYKKALSEEYFNASNMAGKKISLKNFKTDYYPTEDRPAIKKFLSFCSDYISKFNEMKMNIFFSGTPGAGKTFLSCAIGCELIEKGKFVIYTPVQDMISAFENAQFAKDTENVTDISVYNDCDLLIIDDLGAEFKTQFSESVIYNILNNRINSKKPFIVSSNLSHDDISEKYNDRIASRLCYEAISFVFPKVDVRLLKRGH